MPSSSTTPTLRDHRDRVARAILDSPHVGLWRPFVATLDADELVAVATRTTVDDLDWERPLGAAARRRLEALTARRLAGEPMALIRGHVEFCGIEIQVRPGVFAPRPSTELLATEALRRLRTRRAPVLVDLACGVGPVALTVAHRVRRATTWGLDISADAVACGRANARRLGLPNARFAVSDLLAALPARLRGGVDVITAHPPYVPRREVRTLPDELRVFEPEHTLTDGSPDGLGMVRRIAEEAPGWLRPGGWVLVEIGPDLARGVAAALRRGGLDEVRSVRDSVGATRVVCGRLP